ncbi:MAG TPA: hypothetical protein VNU94_07900 [Acidobacteriaceae bacterium]|jgi:hypothetical protein|nr:hypothetical protein [Acidobacteriaceae bacterium]
MHRFFPKILLPLILLLSPSAMLPAQAAAKHPSPQPQATQPQTAAPLPDVPTLLHQVEIARQHNATMMENYCFDATTTSRDSSGKTEVKVTEITYVNGVRLEKLLSKNGVPLPPEDEEKETDRVNKAIAKAKSRVAAAQAKGEETDSNGDPLISLDRLLQIFSLYNERREMVNGRSAIAFDFSGNRTVKTKGVTEGVLHSISGTVWIDEKDHQIARMMGTVNDGYKVGFGLILNIAKGSGGLVEFTPVNNEVWLPSRLDGHGRVRVLLVEDELDGTESTVFSNYQRFGVTTDQTVTLPSQ